MISFTQTRTSSELPTAVEAVFVFLLGNGVSIDSADAYSLHEDLVAVAERRMTKAELAERFRQLFGR